MNIDLISKEWRPDDICEIRKILLKLQLDRGINLNNQDSEGKTLLMKISLIHPYNDNFNPWEMAIIILDSGTEMDMDIKDNDGNTALIYAAMQDQIGIVKLLLDRGANPLIKNNLNERFDDYLTLNLGIPRVDRVLNTFSQYIKDYESKIALQRLAFAKTLNTRLGADTPLPIDLIDKITANLIGKDCVDLPDKNNEKWKEPNAPYNDCEAYERHPEWCKLRGDARKHCCACNGGKILQSGKGKKKKSRKKKHTMRKFN